MTDNQKMRINQLRKYLLEVKEVEQLEFDKWFAGKKEVMINIGAALILIEEDE